MDPAFNDHRSQLATLAAWAMFSRGLEAEFPLAAQEQLAGIKGAALEAGSNIQDLTGRDWFSIDNDDSRDLDQLSLSEPLPQGGLRVWIAVADVDALVKKGTPIDQHAQLNTTSVYTSARIFSMLPERLSTDLTSLNQDEDRLAMVIEMNFSDDGVLIESSIYRALVRNKAQLAYDAMSAWIDGEGELPEPAQRVRGLAAQVRAQDGLAQKLRVLRRAEGSLEFETFQPRAQFDGERIAGIHLQPQNRARQLIEELMIVTNGCTARFLAARGGVALRRVVRSPERWLRIVDVVRGFGTQLPKHPDGPALETFLAHQHKVDPLRFPDLSLVIVKLMGSGEYVVERSNESPIGHFGLAVQDYMHSTAPNRRFPDLITLRLLKAALAGERPPYAPAELAELADHCTLQEDAARKVERQMRKSEAALLLHSRVGERFDGVVTGVSDQGTWVRIFEPPVEGRLRGPVPDLDVGKLVRVHLVSTSVERGFVDFALQR